MVVGRGGFRDTPHIGLNFVWILSGFAGVEQLPSGMMGYRDPQLRVGEKYSNLRPNICTHISFQITSDLIGLILLR